MNTNHESRKELLRAKTTVRLLAYLFSDFTHHSAFAAQLIALKKSTFYLGRVGLMQFIPILLMTLFADYTADHFNRKIIIFLCEAGLGECEYIDSLNLLGGGSLCLLYFA